MVHTRTHQAEVKGTKLMDYWTNIEITCCTVSCSSIIRNSYDAVHSWSWFQNTIFDYSTVLYIFYAVKLS